MWSCCEHPLNFSAVIPSVEVPKTVSVVHALRVFPAALAELQGPRTRESNSNSTRPRSSPVLCATGETNGSSHSNDWHRCARDFAFPASRLPAPGF